MPKPNLILVQGSKPADPTPPAPADPGFEYIETFLSKVSADMVLRELYAKENRQPVETAFLIRFGRDLDELFAKWKAQVQGAKDGFAASLADEAGSGER